MSQGPEDLLQFMRTFTCPPGETPVALLARYDSLLNDGGPETTTTRGVSVGDLDGWRLTVDVHVGAGPELPLLVYVHGGAWVSGNPATHDRLTRELAARGFVVMSVDYPRAPRHRFPAGLDGVMAALDWARRHGRDYGADSDCVVLAGDSAGANLAAAAAVLTARAGQPVQATALCYGIYDYAAGLPVLAPLVGGAEANTQAYVTPKELPLLGNDVRLNPLRGAAELPPTWIGVGADDPLLSQSLDLADSLCSHGVPHELLLAPDEPHSFLQIPFRPHFGPGLDSAARFLHRHVKPHSQAEPPTSASTAPHSPSAAHPAPRSLP